MCFVYVSTYYFFWTILRVQLLRGPWRPVPRRVSYAFHGDTEANQNQFLLLPSTCVASLLSRIGPPPGRDTLPLNLSPSPLNSTQTLKLIHCLPRIWLALAPTKRKLTWGKVTQRQIKRGSLCVSAYSVKRGERGALPQPVSQSCSWTVLPCQFKSVWGQFPMRQLLLRQLSQMKFLSYIIINTCVFTSFGIKNPTLVAIKWHFESGSRRKKYVLSALYMGWGGRCNFPSWQVH